MKSNNVENGVELDNERNGMKLEKIGKAACFSMALLVGTSVFASGFGLYEASSKSYALGGAVMGRACDASANFYNPATLTDLTNITVTVGAMTEHPRGRIKVSGESGYYNMDPGCFVLPHFHLAVPLWYDFTFGLGVMPEYGLGSKYTDDWTLNFNSKKTTVQSVTINPNLAYKVTDKWSIGAGFRILWFDFEQHSTPIALLNDPWGNGPYYFRNRLKGNNGMSDFGYQVGTKYDVRDDFSVGLTYKSLLRTHIKGSSRNYLVTDGPLASTLSGYAANLTGDADTTLDLPQSISAGFNWDITKDWHLGGAVTWTEWSSVGTLNFHIPTDKTGATKGDPKKIKLDWDDTWRFSIAPSWDFAEDWTWLASYVFETDCCGSQDSTMLPPSTRHMISTGLTWSPVQNVEFALTYGVILMDGNDSDCTLRCSTITGATYEKKYEYAAHRALSHATGFTVTYRF